MRAIETEPYHGIIKWNKELNGNRNVVKSGNVW